jgi:hypothetical protein
LYKYDEECKKGVKIVGMSPLKNYVMLTSPNNWQCQILAF